MHHRIAGILTGAVALSLVASGIAVADSVSADADVVVAGDQGLINLGTVAPGSTHQVQIAFDLLCTGTSHSAVNSTITLTPTTTAPTGGSMSATPGTIGPVPLTWPGRRRAVRRRPGAPLLDAVDGDPDGAADGRLQHHLPRDLHEGALERHQRRDARADRPLGRTPTLPRSSTCPAP